MACPEQLRDATLSRGSSFQQAWFTRLGAGHFRFGQIGRLLPLFLRPSRFLRPLSRWISNIAPQALRHAQKGKLASSGWAALSHDPDGRLKKFGSREAAGVAIRLCCHSGSEFRSAFALRCSVTSYCISSIRVPSKPTTFRQRQRASTIRCCRSSCLASRGQGK